MDRALKEGEEEEEEEILHTSLDVAN